jgi:O-antigen/teichoic acid export membrane protein
MSSAKTIAKSTGLLFSTQILDKIFSLILVIIITRYLGSTGFGKYSFAFAFIGISTLLSHLGLTTYIFREMAKDKSKTKTLLNNAITLKFFILIGFYAIFMTIAKLWPKTNEVFIAIIIVMVHEFFDSFNTLIKTMINSHERNHFVLYAKIVEKIAALALAYFILNKGYGIYMLLIALATSKIIASIFYYTVSYRKFVKISFSIDLKIWKNLIKHSLPFWFTMIFDRIYRRIDIVMLSGIKDFTVTGWYSAASTIIVALTFIPGVIINATFPAMSRFHHTNSKDLLKRLYEKTFYYLLSIGIPMSIGISLLANRIILFVYKEQFVESGLILNILSWPLVFVFVNYIMGYLLNSINKQKLFTLSTAICAVSNIGLNFILIPKYSFVGACIATIISQLINFILLYYFTAKAGYPINLIKISYRPLIAGILMGVSIIYLSFLPILGLVPIGVISYAIALFILGGIRKEEINLIKSFLKKKETP